MHPRENEPPPEPPIARPRAVAHSSRVVTSEALMQGETELMIEHRGDVYRLRITRSGKLILQK